MRPPGPIRSPKIHFGTFSLDLRAGELRKSGTRIKLQQRSFQILEILLEAPGQVVSRDKLRSLLWSDGIFVDFDHSISSAINRLRDALGDSAASPRFIETVERKGYRFIYPVVLGSPKGAQADGDGSEQFSGELHSEPDLSKPIPLDPPQPRSNNSGSIPRYAIFAILALSAALFASAAFKHSWRMDGFAGIQSLIVLDIENLTGDPSFNGTLEQAVRFKLEESPFFDVVTDAALSGLSLSEARKKCALSAGRGVLGGTVSTRANGEYKIRVVAAPCKEPSALLQQNRTAANRDAVIRVLGEAIDSLRKQMGEPTESVTRFHTPLDRATTPSVAAFTAFTSAEKQRQQGRDLETVSLYTMATDLDPSFALAYARLGIIYSNAEEYEKSRGYFQKAFDSREHANERERLYITAHYYAANGELLKMRKAYELWRQLYPRDLVPPNNLVSLYLSTGDLDKALEAAREAVRLGPDHAFPYMNLITAYQKTKHFAEANAVYEQAMAMKMDNIVFHQVRYITAFAQDDAAAMNRELEWAKGKPKAGEILGEAALAALARGKVGRARALYSETEKVAINNGLKEFAGQIRMKQAQFEAELGYTSQAHADVRRAFTLAPESKAFPAQAALAFARTGEPKRGKEFLARVGALEPSNVIMNQMILPITRAALELASGKPEAALNQLESVEAYDLSWMTEFSSIYLRGLAELQLNHPDKAASQFEKIVNFWAVRPNSPYVVLAQLGLARAQLRSGHLANARDHYLKFLELWKDADSEIPILREAKTEYAQLQPPSAAAIQ